jgi:hypothetical protein
MVGEKQEGIESRRDIEIGDKILLDILDPGNALAASVL